MILTDFPTVETQIRLNSQLKPVLKFRILKSSHYSANNKGADMCLSAYAKSRFSHDRDQLMNFKCTHTTFGCTIHLMAVIFLDRHGSDICS